MEATRKRLPSFTEVDIRLFYKDVEWVSDGQPYTRCQVAGTYWGRDLVGYCVQSGDVAVVRGACPVDLLTGELIDWDQWETEERLSAQWIQKPKEEEGNGNHHQ
jgi:hypothetical protein